MPRRYYICGNQSIPEIKNPTTISVTRISVYRLISHVSTIRIVLPDLMPSTSNTSFDRVLDSMIRLTVREIAQREGIDNPNALSQAAGLPYETCRRLWQEKATMISLNTIERLCDALRVRPAQLFDYEYEPGKAKRPRNVRRKL
jgi:DNA-binding Xre family transcriptional regulator